MTKRTPQLSIIGPPPMPTTPPPPRHLDEIGRQLWSQITEQFEWSDRGSDEVLAQLCAARQRAERCIRIIDEQGEMLTMRGQIKAHPLLREELANRAFVVRSLAKLGLDLEPLRPGPWSTAWGLSMPTKRRKIGATRIGGHLTDHQRMLLDADGASGLSAVTSRRHSAIRPRCGKLGRCMARACWPNGASRGNARGHSAYSMSA